MDTPAPDPWEGTVAEGGLGATCGACLHQLGVPAELAVPVAVVLAILTRAALDWARVSLRQWWTARRARAQGRPVPAHVEPTPADVARAARHELGTDEGDPATWPGLDP